MLALFAGLVEDPMAHIACFKEIISGPVCDLLWGMMYSISPTVICLIPGPTWL
jgi:hypothetical protein